MQLLPKWRLTEVVKEIISGGGDSDKETATPFDADGGYRFDLEVPVAELNLDFSARAESGLVAECFRNDNPPGAINSGSHGSRFTIQRAGARSTARIQDR